LLLLLLILQSGGLYIAFKLQQYTAKCIMSVTMDRKETVYQPMTLSRSDFEKSLVEKNEIFYQGKMYDIKSRTFSGDSVTMMVIHDEKEGKIFKKIKKLLTHGSKKTPDTLLRLLSLHYFHPFLSDSKMISTSSTIQQPLFSEALLIRSTDVLSPPPKPF
jgi:hypothetical protein